MSGELLRLVALRWSQYDGEYIHIEQGKGRLGRPRRHVTIYVGNVLKTALDTVKMERGIRPEDEDATYVLLNGKGERWAHAGSFATQFSRVRDEAGIGNLTFHDLRGTAVTRLFRADCSVSQIATITGHSLKTVQTILDKHYFHRDAQMSRDAIRRREEYENLPTALPTGSVGRSERR
jgi:integrase